MAIRNQLVARCPSAFEGPVLTAMGNLKNSLPALVVATSGAVPKRPMREMRAREREGVVVKERRRREVEAKAVRVLKRLERNDILLVG